MIKLKQKIQKTVRKAILASLLIPVISMAADNTSSLKIGSISSVRIMAEAKTPKALQIKMQNIAQKNEAALNALSNKGNVLLKAFQKEMPNLSENEKQKRKQELDQIDETFRAQQAKYQQEIAAVRDIEMSQAMNNITSLIRTFAKQENFDLIVQDTVYTSPNVDITDKILKILNQ